MDATWDAGDAQLTSVFRSSGDQVLSGASYLWFFVLRRDRYVPDYRPNPAEIRASVKWAFYSIAGNAGQWYRSATDRNISSITGAPLSELVITTAP